MKYNSMRVVVALQTWTSALTTRATTATPRARTVRTAPEALRARAPRCTRATERTARVGVQTVYKLCTASPSLATSSERTTHVARA